MGAKSRTQLLTVRVTFDKPVGKREAAEMLSAQFQGERWFGAQVREDGADEFTIRSFVPQKDPAP